MWNFKQYAGHTAVIADDGSVLSYSELEAYADAFFDALGGRCLGIILCKNCPGALAGYVGCIKHHLVPIMLASDLTPELIERFISLYRPSFIWTPEARADELTQGTGAQAGFKALNYTLLTLPPLKPVSLHPDLALLITTSGSTGSPHLVRQSYKNLEANTASIVEYLGLTANERPVTSLPMNYTYGLSVINTHLMVGATLLMTDATLMQRNFWDFMQNQRATSLSGVPYTYQMLERLRFERRELPHLKTLTQAGGHLPETLQEKFARYAQEHGKRFVVMYGQSEATARISYLPPERGLEKLGSAGIAIPNVEVSILDGRGCESNAPDIRGELIVRGENVSLGYAECAEDLLKGDERGGVLHTGDLAYFDKDGFIHICGRLKRFLKIFGNRVSLDELEELVRADFASLDCACTGHDDALEIYVTDERRLHEVQKLVARITHLNFTAFNMHFIARIPRNASGKILYQELEAGAGSSH